MPYELRKKKSGKFSVSGPGGVHAKGTTRKKAKAQIRLLHGIEHGMVPRGSGPFSKAEIAKGYKVVSSPSDLAGMDIHTGQPYPTASKSLDHHSHQMMYKHNSHKKY